MNESEIIKKVQASQKNLPKCDVERIVKSFLAWVRTELQDGEVIKIKDLGTLTPKETKARMGRNPKTGEEIEIPAKKTVSFRPSPNFIKNILNGGK